MKNLWIVLLLLATSSFAQDLKSSADQKYRAQEWEAAIKDYKQFVKKEKADSSAWYRLAFCQLQVGEYKKALENFDKALTGKFFPGFTLYYQAKTYALLEDKSLALQSLKAASKNGFGNFQLLETDSIWRDYSEESGFAEISKAITTNAYPCLTDPNCRHFDFWIGEWDVFANGQKVGENSITMANGGCAIHESYTTPGIYTGQSINYYDKLDQKWHQVWVGSGGGVLDYVEINKAEGMLQFQCDYMNQQGKVVKSRLTFTRNDDGTVRQFFENSEDGVTWTPSFDGLYKPKSEE